jgi:hypothetical protein
VTSWYGRIQSETGNALPALKLKTPEVCRDVIGPWKDPGSTPWNHHSLARRELLSTQPIASGLLQDELAEQMAAAKVAEDKAPEKQKKKEKPAPAKGTLPRGGGAARSLVPGTTYT